MFISLNRASPIISALGPIKVGSFFKISTGNDHLVSSSQRTWGHAATIFHLSLSAGWPTALPWAGAIGPFCTAAAGGRALTSVPSVTRLISSHSFPAPWRRPHVSPPLWFQIPATLLLKHPTHVPGFLLAPPQGVHPAYTCYIPSCFLRSLLSYQKRRSFLTNHLTATLLDTVSPPDMLYIYWLLCIPLPAPIRMEVPRKQGHVFLFV